MPKTRSGAGSAQRSKMPSASSSSTKKPKARQLTAPSYKTFQLSKRLRHKRPRIAGSFRLFKQSVTTLKKRKRLFFGITFVYLVLTILLVKGLGVGANIAELKDAMTEVFGGNLSSFATGMALFGVLLGTVTATGGESQASAYQSIVLVVVSLALIWALRQTLSTEVKQKLTIRDAFYKGEYPLIPFLMVLIVIGIQLLPVVVANFLYTTVLAGGLAVTAAEKMLWVLIIGLLILLSLYMITSSIFALYIVTLPDVRPVQALRSARDLVRHRRWTIMRKLLFLPVALLIMAAVVTIPLIVWAPVLAEWVFFGLNMLALAVVHSYLYNLYRGLL